MPWIFRKIEPNLSLKIEQITKADRDACHPICSRGKSRATLRRLSSTVMPLKNLSLSMPEIDWLN